MARHRENAPREVYGGEVGGGLVGEIAQQVAAQGALVVLLFERRGAQENAGIASQVARGQPGIHGAPQRRERDFGIDREPRRGRRARGQQGEAQEELHGVRGSIAEPERTD